MSSSLKLANRRKNRVRYKLGKRKNDLPRLSVFRSGRHIYAQIINDRDGKTIASACSLDQEIASKIKKGSTVESALEVGKLIAERGKNSGVQSVVFDRGEYKYHGRVKALANAAREGGLIF